ncbi:MAG: zinc ribbon domain-containing protein [Candidatus Omnitrophota bacterium]
MSYRFICNHCGKKFELEVPQAKECPFCFWSSSVKREDEWIPGKKGVSHLSKETASKLGRKDSSGNLKYFFQALFFLAILAAIGFLVFKAYRIFTSSSPHSCPPLSIKPRSDNKQIEEAKTDPLALLPVQEKEILFREVTIPANRVPDPNEQEILGRSVSFQTGWTEKLPSPVWTFEQYQKMIADQEAFYKMPFARSYKKKLVELFKTKYLAAADAFAKGDILTARNLWVESLAFPLYSKDLKKHRAVALTMLRAFINDTLSKVSAMNQSLLDRGRKFREQTLSVEYQKLTGLIVQKKWQEALTVTGQMISGVEQLRKNAVPQEVPPPYPASFGTIDLDLQRPLMDLMSPSPSSTADLQPLQQDLVEKKEVIETFTETYLKNVTAIYQSALELIHDKKWQEAAQTLGSLQGPQALQQDAAEKIAILGKMAGRTLDSSGKTG